MLHRATPPALGPGCMLRVIPWTPSPPRGGKVMATLSNWVYFLAGAIPCARPLGTGPRVSVVGHGQEKWWIRGIVVGVPWRAPAGSALPAHCAPGSTGSLWSLSGALATTESFCFQRTMAEGCNPHKITPTPIPLYNLSCKSQDHLRTLYEFS